MSLGRWLLVCWGSEGRSVVNARTVVEGQELKVGDDVAVTGRRGGATRTGKLLMASDDRKLLEMQIVTAPPDSEQLPGPNLYEEPLGDFSPSESDWGPESAANSSDSDVQEEECKKIKLESVKRQYSNKGARKSRTPALRAEAVIPLSHKSMNLKQSQLNYTNSLKRKMDFRKSTPVRQEVPDSTRGQYPKARSPHFSGQKATSTVNTEELIKIKKDITHFKEMLATLKNAVASIKSAVSSDHLYETKYASMPRSPATNMSMPETNDGNRFVEAAIDLPVEGPINNTPEPEMDAMNVSRASSNMQDYKPIRYGLIKHNNGKKRKPIKEASDLNKTVPFVCNVRNKSKNTPKTYSAKKNRPSKVDNGANTSGASDNSTEHCDDMVPIGSGKTLVPRYMYSKINWDSYTMATRKLLMAVFPRRTLATHSLTGKQSPAFIDKPAKLCLDPKKVYDIVITVTKNCHVKETLVRSAITTKCADEYKMLRMKSNKDKSKRSSLNVPYRILNNQENLPPEESYNQTM